MHSLISTTSPSVIELNSGEFMVRSVGMLLVALFLSYGAGGSPSCADEPPPFQRVATISLKGPVGGHNPHARRLYVVDADHELSVIDT